jgi:hypothetical protein
MAKDLENNIKYILKDHFPKISRKELSISPNQTPSDSHSGTPHHYQHQASGIKSGKSTKNRRLNASSSSEYNSELDEEEKKAMYSKDNFRGQKIKVLQQQGQDSLLISKKAALLM